MLSSSANLPPEEVRDFLCRLKSHLQVVLANRNEVIKTVFEKAMMTKGKDYEAAMVDEFVLPGLSGFLARFETGNLNGKQPQGVTLAESTRARKENYAVGSPVRTPGHPFQKVIAAKPKEIFARWKGGELTKQKSAFGQVCPDLALVSPYRTVFECKYFKTVGLLPAEQALVEGLYQAFFYRAMPHRPSSKKAPGWDYEYACFLAYDATQNLRLVNAWNEVRKRIEEAFWREGNIFVMIFPEEPDLKPS